MSKEVQLSKEEPIQFNYLYTSEKVSVYNLSVKLRGNIQNIQNIQNVQKIQNIHYCHLCLLRVPYNCAQFQNKP